MSDHAHNHGFHGPKCWIVTAIVGALVGLGISQLYVPGGDHGHALIPGPQSASGAVDPGMTHEHEDHDGHGHEAGDVDHGHDDGHGEHGIHSDAEGSGLTHPDSHHDDHHDPVVPLWLVIPFALLLGSIAIMPFVNAHFWHQHFPDFAFFLGSLVTAFYLAEFGEPGAHKMHHAFLEYYAFIALVGGLFVVSGGILVDLRGRGGPVLNTTLLAIGAVLANIVGTTGASMLLIRPFMRINEGRLRAMHVVFFIFIISNCAGCLTPIGDPPLYLGFLKGVPFFWTAEHLILNWAFVNVLLLGVFAVADWKMGKAPAEIAAAKPAKPTLSIRGAVGIFCLVLMIAGVFIDPLIKMLSNEMPALEHLKGYPIGATFQIAVAVTAYKLAPKEILASNEFSFFPVKEVGLLFVGIFATMVPALGYLATHGAQLGLNSPAAFYFGTGVLSGVLDNAPTYLNFLQIAFGNPELNPSAPGDTQIVADTVHKFLYNADGSDRDDGLMILKAISTGAVFFGALTYIGNGPNFMVKSIADASGMKMPSFFGYMARAIVILVPILVLHFVFLKLLH